MTLTLTFDCMLLGNFHNGISNDSIMLTDKQANTILCAQSLWVVIGPYTVEQGQ